MHVDDDEDILTLTKMSLEYFGGLHVTQYKSGAEALANITEAAPDLLLLDVMMPDMDGLSLFKKIRSLPGFQDINAVFMTAKAELLKRGMPDEPGVLGVIAKPFDTPELPGVVLEMWRKRKKK